MVDKLRVIIVDDEKHAQTLLAGYLRDFVSEVDVVTTVGSAEEGVAAILQHQPDLVFVDVAMPEMDGLQMLRSFPERNFGVVFVTAYEEFSLEAFDIGAAHYLLKPIDLIKLNEAVERVRRSTKRAAPNTAVLSSRRKRPGTLRLSAAREHRMIDIADIAYLVGERSYTTFHMKDGQEHISSNNIKYFEELLAEHDFFRIHKQYLINLHHVRSFTRGRGGYVYLEDGTTLEISYRKKSEFLHLLDQTTLSD